MSFRPGWLARIVGLTLLAFAGSTVGAVFDRAEAQLLDRFTRGYITPFPEGDRYRLVVFGDSLGDGIWSGLYRAFKPDANVDVVKKSRVSTGFVRIDYYDWNRQVKGILGAEKVHIAVIMVGANDMQSIRAKRRYHKVGTEGWREIYGKRIDAFIKSLKGSRAAIYWVGLPIMRSKAHNQNMQVMNEIFREKAFLNGVKFIDTFNGFADQFGRYSAYGPDLSGRVRKLRAPDGVHFTMRGYRKLAHFVERVIRRDMRSAKSERNIPLAGSEAEQARAMGRSPAIQNRGRPSTIKGKARRKGLDKSADAASGSNRQTATAVPQRSNIDRKSGKAIDGVTLVRPKLSDSAAATGGYAPEGETIAGEMGDGLTALASISPINDPNLTTARRQLPLSQRPYYRVLIKGEQVRPKTGRADDFAWPRS
ncbi:MAG: SGNH/GDSL hydrolase family protein [Methyloligellaceae bacterium]